MNMHVFNKTNLFTDNFNSNSFQNGGMNYCFFVIEDTPNKHNPYS